MPCKEECGKGLGDLCCMECDERKGCKLVCDAISEFSLNTNPKSPAYYKTACEDWEAGG